MYNKIQKERNGQLNLEVRNRIRKVYENKNMSLAELGERFGFSGAFIRGIMLPGTDALRVASKHADRIVRVLDSLEHEAGLRDLNSETVKEDRSPPIATASNPNSNSPDLAQLIKQIYEMGFEVSLKPRQS